MQCAFEQIRALLSLLPVLSRRMRSTYKRIHFHLLGGPYTAAFVGSCNEKLSSTVHTQLDCDSVPSVAIDGTKRFEVKLTLVSAQSSLLLVQEAPVFQRLASRFARAIQVFAQEPAWLRMPECREANCEESRGHMSGHVPTYDVN